MATITKEILSGSTNGRPILVATTATPGTLIHTAVAGATDMDIVWLWAHADSGGQVLAIEFGGTTDGDTLEMTLPTPPELTLVIPGTPLQNGLIIRAFSTAGTVVSLFGYVNKTTG